MPTATAIWRGWRCARPRRNRVCRAWWWNRRSSIWTATGIVSENTLYGQPYVMDTNQSVEQVLKAAGADVVGFKRLAVGEGIEKQADDFAAEVMKQAGLA